MDKNKGGAPLGNRNAKKEEVRKMWSTRLGPEIVSTIKARAAELEVSQSEFITQLIKENTMSKITARVDGKEITADRWQDPYGPTHTFYLNDEVCNRADFHCVGLLAGRANAKDELAASVPMLSDVDFGIQVLGFKMPGAWNKYRENRKENDRKYGKYIEKIVREYFQDFLKRFELSRKYLSLL